MKKISTILIVLFSLTRANACDICGCGVGNSYIGILPDFHSHIFGVRYRYNSMLAHVGIGGQYTYLTTKENYKTIEAWGGWNLGSKFRIMASVPYSFNERINQGVSNTKSGLGDVTLSGYYNLLNKQQTVRNNLLIQSLWVGAGLKLATGKYNPQDKIAPENNANLFQLGTGSTDFSLGIMYDLRLQDAGINLSSNYKVNTVNRHGYQYGNKFSLNSQAYYKLRIKDKVTVAPNAGVQFERSHRDVDKGFSVAASGGNLLLGTVGVETTFSNFAIGANAQAPVFQNLANGIVKANNRVMIHLAVAL